jgi:hypothetical protein
MPLFSALFLLLLALDSSPEPIRLAAPDSAVVERLVWAQSELDSEQVCEPGTSCDDVAINVLALNSLGRFDLARPSLVRAAERTPLWVLASYDYWTASADQAYVREQWAFLTRERLTDDAGVQLATATGLAGMARWRNDTATVARANALITLAEPKAQKHPGIFAPALGLLDADSAESHLRFLADTVHARWPLATGLLALAFYEYHREAEGFALLRSMASTDGSTAAMFVLPLVRGLIGWEVDAPHRALAIEPHLPAKWNSLGVANLRVGAHDIDVTLQRDSGSYSIRLSKETSSPLSVRLSPALPRGARVTGVTVNEADAPIHVEETAYDTHVVIETSLRRELHIEIEYYLPRARRSPQ